MPDKAKTQGIGEVSEKIQNGKIVDRFHGLNGLQSTLIKKLSGRIPVEKMRMLQAVGRPARSQQPSEQGSFIMRNDQHKTVRSQFPSKLAHDCPSVGQVIKHMDHHTDTNRTIWHSRKILHFGAYLMLASTRAALQLCVDGDIGFIKPKLASLHLLGGKLRQESNIRPELEIIARRRIMLQEQFEIFLLRIYQVGVMQARRVVRHAAIEAPQGLFGEINGTVKLTTAGAPMVSEENLFLEEAEPALLERLKSQGFCIWLRAHVLQRLLAATCRAQVAA